MVSVLWLTTAAILGVAQSYILLTANMDDVQAIAKQMLSAPVVSQMGRIWRRAAAQFNHRVQKPRVQLRADDFESDDTDRDTFKSRSRRMLVELAELGRNATVYLQTLRRVFTNYIRE